MALLEPRCPNPKCGTFPTWIPIEAQLGMTRCPLCSTQLRFHCSACGRSFPHDARGTQWCVFCGEEFERTRSA
jgi:hypothetical protein